ncbi:MAG: aminotransferase class I/II-fold pyridoxal phosphate-dependent enzyme [Clostridiaceae bacterium]|nr:aminotransferase class I/II-fold pyridoxal phosphate-dependent enzyme [Clostridiaceae bacterium]
MIHGGDLESFKPFYDGEIIDFSSNINPLGPPEGLKNYLNDSFNNINRYPDINYREAKRCIGKYLKCSDNEIVLGNGAVEIINNFILQFKRVVVFTPCFYEYIKRADILSKEVVTLARDENFNIDILKLYEVLRSGDILILGNPNNPDGGVIEKNMLSQIINLCKDREAFLLLDEAFYEFSNGEYDSIEMLKNMKCKNACVIRAATKFFALPGIRLGYGCTDTENAEKFKNIELPWSINTYAASAAEFIFNDINYIKKTRELFAAERKFMLDELKKLPYLKAFQSQAAFILIKLYRHDEDFIFDYFLKRGILIRKASNFNGLDKSFIRVAVKSRALNKKLLNIFKQSSNMSR